VDVAGEKGWNLGRLERYGFKVPAGGALTAEAYRCFIEENNLLEATGKITQSVTIENIEEKETEQKLYLLREKIMNGHFRTSVRDELVANLENTGILDKPLAVRSSVCVGDYGKASFARIHESFLNVRGIDSILYAIKCCYASQIISGQGVSQPVHSTMDLF